MELNKIHNEDCIETMRQMDDESIDLVVTSPPYNLSNYKIPTLHGAKRNNFIKIGNGYDIYKDDLIQRDYNEWQKKILSELLRVLKNDGAIFYNHKWRVDSGKITGPEYIFEFPLRQIIIWERDGGIAFNKSFFLPTYECIFLICKPQFKLRDKTYLYKDVWKINSEKNNPHPAPFPLKLPYRCINSTTAKIVYDPFMGSGTVAIAALMNGRYYIGSEISTNYCQNAEQRIKDYTQTNNQKLFKDYQIITH